MDTKRRFLFFGVGFSFGLILLFFFLNGKNASCNYLPNARMLEILRSKHRVYDAQVIETMKNKNIDSAEVSALLLYGDINFSKSKPRQEPCRYYWIDGYIKNKETTIYVENCDTLVTIQQLTIK